MAQMRLAACAQHLSAHHAMAGIRALDHTTRIDDIEEAGPATMRVELFFGRKQRRTACRTAIGAVVFGVHILAREWPLGCGLPRDGILLRRQLLAPFFISFDHFICHVSITSKRWRGSSAPLHTDSTSKGYIAHLSS